MVGYGKGGIISMSVLKSKKLRKIRKPVIGLLFTLPCLIGLVWLFLLPLSQSFHMSLSSVSFDYGVGSAIYKNVGTENYRYVFTKDPNFVKYLLSALKKIAVNVPIIVFFSFFAATLIHDDFPGRGIARFMFFLPLVISSATVLTLDSSDLLQSTMSNSDFKSLSESQGFLHSLQIADLLEYTGFPENVSKFVLNAINNVFDTISSSGVQIIVILAALQSVSPALYEVAEVEGASRWEIFWKITFVLISPMLLLCVIYSIVDSFTAYDNNVILYIKSQMYAMGNYGIASAMSWIYFLIVSLILGAIAYFGSKMVFYYDK